MEDVDSRLDDQISQRVRLDNGKASRCATGTPRPAFQSEATRNTLRTPTTTSGEPKRRFYFYTPELNLLAETELTVDATPDIEYEYVWFGGQPIAQIATATGDIAWYFNDHLSTPVLQTDAAAEVIWRVEREPFGKIFEVRAGADRYQPLAFPGQEEDGGDTAYNIHRWYRPGWGRYTQADPLHRGGPFQSSDLSGLNTFLYAGASPTGYSDPLGTARKPGERECADLARKIENIRKALREMEKILWITRAIYHSASRERNLVQHSLDI